MSDKSLKMTITERYEIETLSNIFGEEDLFGLQYDCKADPEIEYELEVVVRRIGRKKT